jgi:hypothetical protein
MISYEDLCQALDRFNGRRRNAEEMASLEGGEDDVAGVEAAAATAEQVAAGFAEEAGGADAMATAEQAQYAAEEAGQEDPGQQQALEAMDPQIAGAEPPLGAGAQEPAAEGFADQPPEDTHEIDVDDMMVEDRLTDDKLPGD